MKKRIFALLLAFVMLVGMLPINAFAAASTAAEDAVVYVSGAKGGTLCLVNQPVTVKDLNADGLLSYDEALQAAHETYCPGGYVSLEGSYGLQVGMLWSEGDGNFANALFYNNDEALQMNVGESYVEGGDRLYACMLKYSDGWGDAYAYFGQTELTVDSSEEFTLTLNGSSYMGAPIACEEIKVGTWNDSTFTEISGKNFDADGNVTLSFDQAGTYIVSAEGEYYDEYGSLTPIMPPYCTVTVNQAAVTVERVSLDKESLSMTVGDDPITLAATVFPNNATNQAVTWSSDNEAVATVDDTGKVTAVAAGAANIKVTTEDGSKTAICAVTVTAAVSTPVEITDQAGLAAMKDGGNYKLMADITLDSTWAFLKDRNAYSTAITLDGNGHSIDLNGRPYIFINVWENDVVKNLIVKGKAANKDASVAGITSNNRGTIRNCMSCVELEVTDGGLAFIAAAGGFVGSNLEGGTVQNCFSTATMPNKTTGAHGGIVGNLSGGTISGCYVAGLDVVASTFNYGGTTATEEAAEGNSVLAEGYDVSTVLSALNEAKQDGDLTWGLNADNQPVPGGTGSATTDPGNGDDGGDDSGDGEQGGEQDGPTEGFTGIYTQEDLAKLTAAGKYQLMNDIVLENWTPISTVSGDTTVLDGNGYTITLTGTPVFDTMKKGTVVQNLILDGVVSRDGSVGSLAYVAFGATVQNCASYAAVTYTGNGGSAYVPHYAAGIVGSMTSDATSVSNCLYAGSLTLGSAAVYGSIANNAFLVNGKINNCVGVGSDRIGSAEGMSSHSAIAVGTNVIIADADQFAVADYVATMNANVPEGCLTWGVADSRLVPGVSGGSGSADPDEPDEPTFDGTWISNQTELAAMASAVGNYKLKADITLDSSWTAITLKEGTTLDGDGHSVTLNGIPLFKDITKNCVISNLVIKGSVTGSSPLGSLTNINRGTVRNCASYADINYTGSAGGDWMPYYAAGLIGYTNGGAIINCLYAGAFTNTGSAGAYGSIGNIYEMASATITNCVGVGSDRLGSTPDTDWSTYKYIYNPLDITDSNTLVASADAFSPANYVSYFNENLSDGDLTWGVEDGYLIPGGTGGGSTTPTDPDATEDELAVLSGAIVTAEEIDTSKKVYTAESLSAFKTALSSAKTVVDSDSPKQSIVTKATTDLTAAREALTERSLAAVDLSDKDVISITTADELETMQAGKYYRLDADITLGQYWIGYTQNTMNSVLDGNGHTVTLIGKPLWSAIGPNGVVQNLGIKGKAQNSTNDTGAFAKDCEGLIVNCWSHVQVNSAGMNSFRKNTGGFVANMKSGGAIVNSYVSGSVSAAGSTGDGKMGIFAGTATENTMVKNGYWLSTVEGSVVGAGSGNVTGCASKARADFYSDEFLTLLNNGKGANGKTWTINDEGWPHLGAAGSYTPPQPIELAYTAYEGYGSGTTTFTDEKGLLLSLVDVLPDPDAEITYYVGKFSYPGFDGVAVFDPQYEANGQGNHKVFVSEEGELQVLGAGSLEVLVRNGDIYADVLTRFTVSVSDIDADAVRLVPSGEHVTENGDGTYNVAGSALVSLNPEIQVDGVWRSAPSSLFAFEDTGALRRTGSTLYATEPGDMTVTASYQGKSGSVTITSTYVPVTSITPSPNGTYVIHGRDANTAGSGQFLDLTLSHDAGTVVVQPENASYHDNWTLTTSDPEIAYYGTSYMMAIVPVKAGTVTLTATSTDPKLTTPVTGTSTITLEYFNPLQTVTISQTKLTVKENERIALPLTFTGAKNADGYHVSEPGMVWTFSGDGEVEITRDPLGVIVVEEGSKEYCVANDAYKLIGTKAGTVTVTGTPVDNTGDAEPVTFNVEVTSGTPETPADNDELVEQGMAGAWNYLGTNGQYEYGDEWIVFALARSGKEISEATVKHYLDSVKEAYSDPGNAELKPTTIARVMLTVSALGEDAADLAGIDLVELLCTSNSISAGSNEAIWALIGLDAMDYEVPANATWTREALIAEILKYQNETTGAFGLTNKASTSLDMTAMAVQALAPYYETNAKAKSAVDAAFVWLQKQMDRNCDFGSSESTAQVMIALTAMEMDPLDEDNGFLKSVARNLITSMDNYRFADGGYKHFLTDKKSNSMATQQVLLALEAYRRFAADEDRLYDLNGNGETKYTITVMATENGSVTVSKTTAPQGETITITASPAVAYELDTVKVTTVSGTAVAVSNGKFTMPDSDVTVTATFKRVKNAATAVEEVIANLKVVKANQKTRAALQELQTAYDSLTEQEKKQVSNAADLEKLWDAFEKALDQYVTEKTDTLNDYIKDLGESNYTAEKWNEIEEIQTDASAAFAKADTTEDVDKLYADAILKAQDVSFGNTITVSFTLLGDSEHGSSGTVHTLADGNLTTWIGTSSYQLEAPATVLDVFKLAVKGKYSYVNRGNYISSVNGLSEFDNGPYSGWKYTLNGIYPNLGVEQQSVKNGDVIVFHYTDDYTKESGNQSLGDRDEAVAAKAEAVIETIGTVTLESKGRIDAARKAYDALTFTQKKLVGNYDKLTAAESKYAELKKADDEKKADAVEKLIDQLDSHSASFASDVKAAQKAYNALTADQKKLVDNYTKLAAALKELANEEDKEAAEAVEKLIKDIGTVTKNSEDKIKAAREAYNKLTDEQKALVENLKVLEAAEEKLAELNKLENVADIYKSTGDYLEKLGIPTVNTVGGEWMVIGLARSDRNVPEGYYDNVVKFVQENIDESERLHNAKSTENARVILALTAIGKDVTDVDGHNLLSGLNDMDYVCKQGINGPIWALLAFDSGNYPTPAGNVTRDSLIHVILEAQLADGGWALSGDTSDADMTGMALQALAPYCSTNADVKAAVAEAIATLTMMQAADGSFASIDGTSSESSAQVITALAALGIDAHTDARFIKNGVSAIDALCAFYVEGGGFKHIPDGNLDGMATEQGYYALTAYFRMLEGKTALYDMTDVIDMGGDVTVEEPVETLPAETESAPTEPVETPTKEGRSFPWWLVIVIVVLAGAIMVLVIISKPKKGRHMK